MHIQWRIADDYIDVFLLPVIILTPSLFIQRYILNRSTYNMPFVLAACYVLVFIVFSEIIFPALSPNFTKDINDVWMIIAGGFIFYFFINKSCARCCLQQMPQ